MCNVFLPKFHTTRLKYLWTTQSHTLSHKYNIVHTSDRLGIHSIQYINYLSNKKVYRYINIYLIVWCGQYNLLHCPTKVSLPASIFLSLLLIYWNEYVYLIEYFFGVYSILSLVYSL